MKYSMSILHGVIVILLSLTCLKSEDMTSVDPTDEGVKSSSTSRSDGTGHTKTTVGSLMDPAPTGTTTPMDPPPTGTTTPMDPPPTGTTTPMDPLPTGTTTPMDPPPTGTTTPMDPPPTGTTTPMDPPPTGTTTPMDPLPTGTTTPMDPPPTGTTSPIDPPPTGTTTPMETTNTTQRNVSYILETSTKTFQEFQNITLICRAQQDANVTWYFRHARTYFVWEYAYDLSLTLAFYNRFRDRYTVSETITDGLLTSVLEITSTLPGDRGWYSCVDVNKTINSTTFVDFKYDTCGDNGVQSEKFGCIEFLHEDECANKNGSLAVIHTSQKDKWIYDIAFHVHKATELEIKLGLTLSANTMLWKDLAWVDGSSLTFAQWFGGRLSASECKRCLEEDVPMVLGIKFHMDVGRVWQWVRTQEVACEWREQQHITGIRIAPGRTSYTGDKDLFRCLVSGEYISSEFVCDTASDCWDQSDEEDCGEACSGTSFQCNCGGCVSASTVCDFYWDCSDGSDENNCNYPPCEGRSQWQCNNLQCIASYDVCDGETECADGSDEADILCKENPYIPTAYSYKCSTPDVIFPSARLCDRTLDCVSGNDESTQTMQCLTRVYSCGSLLHNDASNITAVAVSLGLVQYGATNVNCTLKANSMETTWPFENELAKRPLSTYSGSPLISEAVWIDVRPFVVTQIDYTNTEVQLQLVTKATSCVQYIRGCVNVMGRARDSVLVEWISGLNGNTNALNVSVEGCSGYCTTSECKLTPSVQNTQIPTTPNTAGSNWVAITKKDELPVSDITSEKTIILAVSPLICTEVATDVDPAYASNPKFCKNGMVYYQKDRCLMDFDPTGEPTACRDLTHLQDCEEFECPVNYAKCPGSFCLHQRFICDGRSHCPNQEDEFECDRGTCDGHYKCRSTQQCVPFSQLCDGVRHCRRGDDELNCQPTCPDNCKCRGMTFQCDSDTNIIPLNRIHSDARWINLTTNMSDLRPHVPVSLQLVTTLILKHCSIRELLISGQSLFQNMSALRHLDLSFNNIETLSKNIFPKMWLKVLILSHNPLFRIERDFFSGLNSLSNLQIAHTPLKDLQTSMPRQSVLQHLTKLKDLDLSSNLIEEVPAEVLKDLRSLSTLNLSKNPITTIDITAFVGMHSLHRLTVTHTELQQIRTGTFNDFTSLAYLNISASHIQDIQTDVFANLGNLKTLDIHDNLLEIHEFLFNGLDNLAFLYTDSYKMCCIRPDSVASDNCFAPEESISSCSNLVGLGILRICLWLIGVTAVLGNAFVIIYRTIIDRKHMKKSYSLFVINLSMSDFLMGVYMLIIASVDAHYSGRYVSYDKSWRESALCATAGILSMISSEMSTFIILLITMDRFIAIVFPLSTRKLTWRRAGVVVSIVWLLTIGIAITPQVFIQAYFKGEFYSRSGVCLALPLTGESSPGDEYAAAIFIGLNSLVFLLIVMAQVYIYRTMKGSGSLAATQNRRIEMELAKSLFLVVATDFCCWFPIGVIGLWAQTGGSISPDVYAWVMVLVLPINSAINPFLYTYTYIKRKRTTTGTMRSSTSYTSDRGSLLSSSKTTVPVFYDLQQTNILKEIYFSKLFEGKRGICLESHLSDHLLSPGETFQIAYHIIRGLSFLHLRGIIHGNVSKECVFIKTSKQVVSRATLVMDVKNVSLQHQGPSVDIQQYGTLIKLLLRKLSKR